MKRARDDLTIEQINRLLVCDPINGEFYWRPHIDVMGRYRPGGKRAGHIDKHKDGRVVINIKGKNYFRARLMYFVMTGKWPEGDLQVDHLNRIKTDDQFENLKLKTPSANSLNRTYKSSKGLPKGVKQLGKRYQSRVSVNRRWISLGTYDTIQEAREVAETGYVLYHSQGKDALLAYKQEGLKR